MLDVRRSVAALLIISATGLSCVESAQANPITISDAFLELYNISPNTLGFTPGDRMRIGSDSVVPNADSTPSSPTTGVATTTNTVTNATVTKNITFSGSTASPNFYSNSFADNPALYGPWTLTYTNTTNTLNTASATAPALPAGIQPAPFVQSITISGSGGNPTFSWTPPAGATVNAYKINIYDKNLVNAKGTADAVLIETFAPSVTSFTVPTALAGGLTLDPTHNYSIEITLEQSRNGATITNNSNSNVAAMSRIYADFKPLPGGTPQVNLPVTLANGSYQFNMTVTAGQTYYIDPTVATGYVYKTGAGDPNFASVILPNLLSSMYDLTYLSNGLLSTVLLAGGTQYFFVETGNVGIDTFTVTGIDPNLMLDPSNTTAFVTGLTFVGGGSFTGTQTPITTDIAATTPLPAALPLFAGGLGILGWFGSRRKRKSIAAVTAT